MTSLLDILREIEPDAGWQISSVSGDAYIVGHRARIWCAASHGITHPIRVVVRDAADTCRAMGEAADLQHAVIIALAGYRAGEK
jgi:hypothetical protein